MTRLTELAQMASHLMTLEAERLQHRYLGPEHVLLALLRQDSTAARLLRAHGIDLESARAGAERLIAQGVLRARGQATPRCWPRSASTSRRCATV